MASVIACGHDYWGYTLGVKRYYDGKQHGVLCKLPDNPTEEDKERAELSCLNGINIHLFTPFPR